MTTSAETQRTFAQHTQLQHVTWSISQKHDRIYSKIKEKNNYLSHQENKTYIFLFP